MMTEHRSPSMPTDADTARPDHGMVIPLLRIEGALALGLSAYAYFVAGGSWGLFALLFLLPDLTMLGYLSGSRARAAVYNAGHSYLSPAVVAGIGLLFGLTDVLPVALIWAAHIGFDRAMGYGLKYPHAFGATHLGWKGRHPAPPAAAS